MGLDLLYRLGPQNPQSLKLQQGDLLYTLEPQNPQSLELQQGGWWSKDLRLVYCSCEQPHKMATVANVRHREDRCTHIFIPRFGGESYPTVEKAARLLCMDSGRVGKEFSQISQTIGDKLQPRRKNKTREKKPRVLCNKSMAGTLKMSNIQK